MTAFGQGARIAAILLIGIATPAVPAAATPQSNVDAEQSGPPLDSDEPMTGDDAMAPPPGIYRDEAIGGDVPPPPPSGGYADSIDDGAEVIDDRSAPDAAPEYRGFDDEPVDDRAADAREPDDQDARNQADDRYQPDVRDEDSAVDACARSAEDQAGGGARVSNILNVDRTGNGWDVRGTIDILADGPMDEGDDPEQHGFRCSVTSGGMPNVAIERF